MRGGCEHRLIFRALGCAGPRSFAPSSFLSPSRVTCYTRGLAESSNLGCGCWVCAPTTTRTRRKVVGQRPGTILPNSIVYLRYPKLIVFWSEKIQFHPILIKKNPYHPNFNIFRSKKYSDIGNWLWSDRIQSRSIRFWSEKILALSSYLHGENISIIRNLLNSGQKKIYFRLDLIKRNLCIIPISS